jgi:TonB family protein
MAKPDPSKKGKKGKVSITMVAPTTGEMIPDNEGVYANAEVLPGFPGGQKGLEKFFEDNIQYPADASDNGVEGVVNIKFAVDENGKVYAPKVTSDNIGYGIEQEALRVFNKMPKWTPGKIKGKNVKTRFTLPVRFQLS